MFLKLVVSFIVSQNREGKQVSFSVMKPASIFALCCLMAVSAMAQPTAKEWNQGVVGWNLGNQFECSAPGQDGESMQIGMPENSIKAETAWFNPVVYPAARRRA